MLNLWKAALPAGCSACTSFLDVMKLDRSTQTHSKLAFLSLAEDTVISADYGYTLQDYGPAVESLFSTNFGGDPNVATYIVGDFPGHVVEAQASLEPDYMPWLAALATDGSAWVDTTIDGGAPDGG